MTGLLFGSAVILLCPQQGGLAAEDGAYPVAGVRADQRPAGAPEIVRLEKTAAWYGTALTGLTEPYPYSLKFLEDQGAWHTPFVLPGMTGPYDLRGWHEETSSDSP